MRISKKNSNGDSPPQKTGLSPLLSPFLVLSFVVAWCATFTAVPVHALVLNVRECGAAGDGVADDTAAINSAINLLNSQGPGVLYFPPGEYRVDVRYLSEITIDGAWVRGDGDASILRRVRGTGTRAMLNAIGVKGLVVSDMAFDLDVENNFTTGINCGDSENVRVINCLFYSTALIDRTAYPFDPTIHAILAMNTREIWVQGCRCYQMQMKMAGSGSSGPGVFVLDNYYEDVFNGAISWVGSNNAILGPGTFRGARLSGNIVLGIAGSFGFFLGQDGEPSMSGMFQGLQVCNNQFLGNWDDTSIAILANAAAYAEDYIIADNILRNDSVPGSQVFGILVRHWENTNAPTILDDCLIMGNRVEGTSFEGIYASGRHLRILNNHISDTRGLTVASAKDDPQQMTRAVVRGNTCRQNLGWGIYLNASHVLLQPVTLRASVTANTCGNSTTGWEPGALLLHTGSTGTIVADIFANELSDDQAVPTQYYGAKHYGSGKFELRYFDNDIRGQLGPSTFQLPTNSIARDNRGW